jgi:hypothetical protein
VNVDCPNKDGGICTIPEKAVVVTAQRVTLMSPAELERAFPDFDVRQANLRPFNFEGSDDELAQSAVGAGDVSESLMEGVRESPSSASVIVLCSCGHRFIADV